MSFPPDKFPEGRTCREHAAYLFEFSLVFPTYASIYALLFFGGLRGIPIGPKPCISPDTAPYALCGPPIGIGIAPFLSACILEPFCVESTEFLCCGGGPPKPFVAEN